MFVLTTLLFVCKLGKKKCELTSGAAVLSKAEQKNREFFFAHYLILDRRNFFFVLCFYAISKFFRSFTKLECQFELRI